MEVPLPTGYREAWVDDPPSRCVHVDPREEDVVNHQLGLGLLQKASEVPHGCQVLLQLADALAGMCTEDL